jgi:sulfonate transport system substrate-binding protein
MNMLRISAVAEARGSIALTAAGCSSAGSSSSPAPAAASAAPGASSSSAVNLSSVTLDIGDQKGTGAEAVLTAAGLLSSLPFHVSWSDFTSGPPMLEAMASGSVDIGGVGDAPPVFAASGGEAVEIVGARQTNGDQDAVVVPKNSPITSITQLKGKKIAYGSGSSANYDLLTVLTKAGLTTKDVTLVNLQPAEALAAFTSGSVDAWDIWPPYVQQVVAQDNARVLATGGAYGSPYSFEVAAKAAVANPGKAAAIRSTCRRWTRPTSGQRRTRTPGLPPGARRRGCPPVSWTWPRRSTPTPRSPSPARSPRPSRTWSTSSTQPG